MREKPVSTKAGVKASIPLFAGHMLVCPDNRTFDHEAFEAIARAIPAKVGTGFALGIASKLESRAFQVTRSSLETL